MVLIYRKSNRKLLKTIPLCILTLAVFWISTRPDLHHHELPIESSCCSWPFKRINNNHFTLLPVLVLPLRKFNERIIAPLHHSQTTWNKHGYLCLSPPDFDPDIDITIYMDIATNPGPVNTTSRSDKNSLKVLYAFI